MKHIGWLLFILFSSNALSADEVEIPLLAETTHLQSAISRVLELDDKGQSTLRNDLCNQLELSDVQVAGDGDKLSVGMALTATTGAHVLGVCRGPKPWLGRLALKLTPQVTESGLAIEFVPDSIELSRPDNSPGLLSKPVKLIADALVLPRMKSVKVDLAGPLNNLDELIEQLLGPDGEPSLVERSHISRIQTEETGVRAWLAFQVQPPETADVSPEPILDDNELAEWQTLEDELDGFLTTIITMLAQSTDSRALRLELFAVLLDARHAIAEALTIDDPESDPVRELFLSSWDRLRPLMGILEGLDTPGLEVDFRLAAFLAGGDALRALDALGPEYGLEITRDGLRRLARLLMAESVPPSFTPLPLEVDPEFRDLFGFNSEGKPELQPMPLSEQITGSLGRVGSWLMPAAHADSINPAEALKGMVPKPGNLDTYLELVARLLEQQAKA